MTHLNLKVNNEVFPFHKNCSTFNSISILLYRCVCVCVFFHSVILSTRSSIHLLEMTRLRDWMDSSKYQVCPTDYES